MPPPPFISVVIPTFHRNDTLAKCLDCLSPGRQTLKEAYEVIVTDAGYQTTSEAMLRERYPWAKWLGSPRKVPGANRNAGARKAGGDWLAFLDDDCLVEKNFLQSYFELAQKSAVDVIEGKIICPDEIDHPFYVCPINLTGGVFWSGNLAIRRAIFLQMGGFDEELGRLEDMEFGHRLHAAQVTSVFNDIAPAYHPRQKLSFSVYWNRFLLNRWTLLYRIKIGASPSLGTNWLQVLLVLWGTELLNLLRTTSHLFTRHDPLRWKRQCFDEMWKWFTLPIMLPYLTFWEIQFRSKRP